MSLLEQLLAGNNTSSESSRRQHARAYIRVSHERSAEKNISPETQRNRIQAYARECGYVIKEWYEDLGISAFKNDELRVGWHRLLDDAKTDPDTTVIIVWRYDRFSRGHNAESVQHDLLRHGVRIESAEEGYYDPESESGAIMMPLQWGLSRMFSIKLRNVVIPNMKTNFETRDPETGWAYKNGGWSQFGYKKHRIKVGRNAKSMDVHKVVWLLDDTEVAGKPVWQWARTMLVDWRLKERLGYDSIAARLTAAGVPTPSGRDVWSNSTVQALIGDWSRLFQYAGVAFWNREDCTDRKNRKRRDPSEWTVVENAHPAIISMQEAEEITAMVSDQVRTKTSGKGKASRWALSSGLLVCSSCGANYSGTRKGTHDYYVCGAHLYRRGEGCEAPAWYIPREELEEMVTGRIIALFDKSEAELQAWIDGVNKMNQDLAQAQADTAKERAKEEKALSERLSNLYDIAAATGVGQELKEKIESVSAALNRLRLVNDVRPAAAIQMSDVQAMREELLQIASDSDQAKRQQLLKKFVIQLTADGQTKTLSGRLHDPRALLARSVAVPRGRVPSRQDEVRFTASYRARRGFWGAGKDARGAISMCACGTGVSSCS